MKRDISIELFRCWLMLGICILHAFSQGAYSNQRVVNLLSPCVCGFVFISGWFGIRFNLQKVVQLYMLGFYAAIICAIGDAYLHNSYSLIEMAKSVRRLWIHYWFLHAYVVLMCFAPLVDCAFARYEKKDLAKVLGPILAFTFVWSWSGELPYLKFITPHTSGLGSYSGFALLSTYIVSRLCKNYCPNVSKTKASVIFILSGAAVFLCGGEYHSPFAVVFAASTFYLFKSSVRKLPRLLEGVVMGITPSLFAVYLLHSHSNAAFEVIKRAEIRLAFFAPPFLACILVGLAVFIVCLLLDAPRRSIIQLFQHLK